MDKVKIAKEFTEKALKEDMIENKMEVAFRYYCENIFLSGTDDDFGYAVETFHDGLQDGDEARGLIEEERQNCEIQGHQYEEDSASMYLGDEDEYYWNANH